MLLLEGKPYWDTKFLVRTLSADRSIELTSVVQMAEGRLLQRKIPRRAPAAGKAGRAGAVSPLLAQRAGGWKTRFAVRPAPSPGDV